MSDRTTLDPRPEFKVRAGATPVEPPGAARMWQPATNPRLDVVSSTPRADLSDDFREWQ